LKNYSHETSRNDFITLSSTLLFSQVTLRDICIGNGKYNVGYKQYLTSDSTRTYNESSTGITKKISDLSLLVSGIPQMRRRTQVV
jgi:hypothetical protein